MLKKILIFIFSLNLNLNLACNSAKHWLKCKCLILSRKVLFLVQKRKCLKIFDFLFSEFAISCICPKLYNLHNFLPLLKRRLSNNNNSKTMTALTAAGHCSLRVIKILLPPFRRKNPICTFLHLAWFNSGKRHSAMHLNGKI